MSLLPASEKKALILQRMSNLGVKEIDLEETPVDASAGVVLAHRPSGLFVKCQATPDREQNRLIALRLLLDKVEVWQRKSRSHRYVMKRAVSLSLAIFVLAVAALLYWFFRNQAFQP